MHARADADARPCGRDLLDNLKVDLERLPAAAILLWVGQPEQARPAKCLEHITGKRSAALRLIDPGKHLLLGR